MSGPSAAAPAFASRAGPGNRPVTVEAAAAADSVLNDARIHDPVLSGEVGLTVRSMYRNLAGRPRSRMRAVVPTAAPAAAVSWLIRAISRRPVASPRNAMSADEPA